MPEDGMIVNRYQYVLRHSLRQWRSLVVILGLTAATSLITALQPWPLKILVDYALSGQDLPERLRSLLGILHLKLEPATLILIAAVSSLGLYALNATIDAGLSLSWAMAGQRMVYDLTEEMLQRLQRLSPRFHQQQTVGDLLNRLTGDTYCAYTLPDALLVSPGRHLLTLVSIGLVAWTLDPLLTIFSLAVVPTMVISALCFGSWLKRWTQRHRETQSSLFSFVHQTLTAIPVVQAFGTENLNRQRFQVLATDAVKALQQNTFLKSAYSVVSGSVSVLSTATVLYVGGQRVLSGAMTVGSLLVFLTYVRSMQSACRGLLANYGSLKSLEASIDRLLGILNAEDYVREMPGAKALPSKVQGQLCFEQVSFGYHPQHPVLHNISLQVNPGETLAIVGPTGAGKSTLVSLIPRFFDPWQGRILLDGVDIRHLPLKSLRSHIALVLQEPFLLPLTVAENIAYSRPDASGVEIRAAAEAANADVFIRRLPQGYDTAIGERGATLSGGEKQRIAIARALLKDAPILILDEPTSALDAQTEVMLLEALERLMAGRTTFVIAHRLSTIRRADRIVVLEGGRIVEMGTLQELLKAQRVYYRLYRLQSQMPNWEVVR